MPQSFNIYVYIYTYINILLPKSALLYIMFSMKYFSYFRWPLLSDGDEKVRNGCSPNEIGRKTLIPVSLAFSSSIWFNINYARSAKWTNKMQILFSQKRDRGKTQICHANTLTAPEQLNSKRTTRFDRIWTKMWQILFDSYEWFILANSLCPVWCANATSVSVQCNRFVRRPIS